MTAKKAQRQIEGGREREEMETECKAESESERNAIFRSLMCKSKCFLYNWVRTAHYSRLREQAFRLLTPSDPSRSAAGSVSHQTNRNLTVVVFKRCHIVPKRRGSWRDVWEGRRGRGRAFLWTNENKAHSASLLVIRPID